MSDIELVIKISEDSYKATCNGCMLPPDVENVVRGIKNGTPIPDNATNGDVVQMIFPYYSYERNDYVQSTEDYIVDSMECMEHDLYFGYDWWNAPYQKGGANEKQV